MSEKRGIFEVDIRVRDERMVEAAEKSAVARLKDEVWKSAWRDEIDLPGMEVKRERCDDGWKVTAIWEI